MTDKQPEALRLADELNVHVYEILDDRREWSDNDHGDHLPNNCIRYAAAELRRLHEVNAELVEVLKDILSWEENEEMTWYPKARAALTKATGEQQ